MNSSLSTNKLLRYVVGYVFMVSGCLLFLSRELGQVFMNLPFPAPTYLMYAVAIAEVVCGILIIANKEVKKATIPLLIIIVGALLFTKVPILHSGFLQFAFAARLDIVMLVLLYILYKSHHE